MLNDFFGRRDWLAAARRWELVRQQHDRTREMVSKGERPDTLPRQLAAARRALELAPKVAAENGEAKALGLRHWLSTQGQERLIGRADFEPGSFLEVGLAVGRAVCLIELKDRLGGVLLRGTGFLVAPGVLITNNHVLKNDEEAGRAMATFDYRNDPYGRAMPTTVFSLDPKSGFETSREYDCTFVAVGNRMAGNASIDAFGWLPLVGAEGKVEVGDPINIIQHPGGEPMQWVIRENRLLSLPELANEHDPKVFAHYEADTLPGSSGAACFSRLWEVFALHHQAVPAVDMNGNILGIDGMPYAGNDDSRIKWVGNEGIRVSALVRFAQSCKQNRAQETDMLDALLSATRPDYIALADAAHRHDPEFMPVRNNIEGAAMSGKLEFSLPLRISISLDEGDGDAFRRVTASAQTSAATVAVQAAQPGFQIPSTTPTSEATMPAALRAKKESALGELEASQTRVYLDTDKEQADRTSYYGAFSAQGTAEENFAALSKMLSDTHQNPRRYAPSRELYPWIDLYKLGRRLCIKGIYSGQTFEASAFIEEAFAIEARREALRASFRSSEAFRSVSETTIDALLEQSVPYNCEHSVPQSWLHEHEPMRGDMHHLFACEPKCNTFRSNHAYFDFPPHERMMDACGQQEANQFEPASGKGAVARATLYFLMRYPGQIDLDKTKMTVERIETLQQWHAGDAVTEYERHRNQAIFEAQGNRNPLIDFPGWADKIAFVNGLR